MMDQIPILCRVDDPDGGHVIDLIFLPGAVPMLHDRLRIGPHEWRVTSRLFGMQTDGTISITLDVTKVQ